MDNFLIFLGVMVGLQLLTRLLFRKTSIIKEPCTIHKWEYVENGMKCSVCGRKPGEGME